MDESEFFRRVGTSPARRRGCTGDGFVEYMKIIDGGSEVVGDVVACQHCSAVIEVNPSWSQIDAFEAVMDNCVGDDTRCGLIAWVQQR